MKKCRVCLKSGTFYSGRLICASCYSNAIKKRLSGEKGKAYRSWSDQRGRCNNPRHFNFKWYGKRGIKVNYSSADFVKWWLFEVSKKGPGRWVCDRIDSNGNYEFGNIQLITQSENAKKMDRSKIFKAIKHLPSGKIFKSGKDAAEYANTSQATVTQHCRGLVKNPQFSYAQK